MSKRKRDVLPILIGCILAMTAGVSQAAEKGAVLSFVEAAQRTPGSAPVTAIGMRATRASDQLTLPTKIVLLVDTSASQIGEYRQAALDSLAGIFEDAREADRFLLAAVDVGCTPLAKDFLPSKGKDMQTALLALDARTPLGSTDIIAALDAAAVLFGQSTQPCAIIYIGDGPGLTAVDAADFQRVVDTLRSKHITFSGVGIGAQINWPCLAAIASATGGMLMTPGENVSAKDAGSRLGALAIAPVSWPDEVVFSSDAPDPRIRMLPGRLPPLRSDRDSIVLVEGRLSAAQLEMVLECGGTRSAAVVLEIPSATPRADNAFILELAANASDSNGVFLPLLGREGFELARGAIRDEAMALAELSRQAESAGSHASAVRLADASLRRDPDNVGASLVRSVALKSSDNLPAEADSLPERSDSDSQPNELAEINRLRKVRGQQIEQDIAVQLRDARQLMASDPGQSGSKLKELKRQAESESDLEVATRDRLVRQIEISLRESTVRSREKIERDLVNDRRAAIGRERMKLDTDLRRKDDKIKQLTEKYNTLVGEGVRVGYQQPTTRFHEAEREVGLAISEEAPGLPASPGVSMTARLVGQTAPAVARILDYDSENMRVRRDSQRGFMDALHLCDVAHIPFPDEPPIEYPNRERWKKITEMRQKYKSVDLANPSSAEKKIYEALDKKVENFEFTETPLRDVIAAVEDSQGIPVEIDSKAFEDAGLDLETPLTKSISGVSLRSALRLLLGDLDLTYIIKDEVLLITTKDKAAENIVVKVYPVADLVLPVNPSSGVNPFQSGGGMGGGGMGGGLGQQGGMGGGGMGGGQFQISDARARVARDKPASAPARVAAPAVAPPQASATATVMTNGEDIGLPRQILEADGLRAAISDYLEAPFKTSVKASVEAPAAGLKGSGSQPLDESNAARELAIRMDRLRVSAAELGKAGQFDRAADLLAAAITCGHAEPWMYEALALAMGAAGRSREDIDRVLLSSADSAVIPSDLLLLANYLARSGSAAQAIRLCKQTATLDPTQREAFALAMALAASSDDLGALQWACPGVLAHQWPASQQEVPLRAARLAKATIEQLKKAGQADAALAFKAAVDKSLVRDIDLQISWSGEADIDLVVEEPPGTVCSLSSPRSTSGGTLLGDAEATAISTGNSGAAAIDAGARVQRERYTASEAFPGTYRVLIRRAWGRVAADTITVQCTLHVGTDREQKMVRQMPLGADEVLLSIDVPAGRRRESLLDATIAQDIVAQQHISRAILAQQLNSLSDPNAARALSQSRAGGGRPVPGLPFFRGGAVGYQPQISTLPEGANYYARAVVSADRRYVRVTTTPLFSGVGQVTQFSSSGGSGAAGAVAGGGAAGGQGAGQGVGGGGQIGGQQGGQQGGQIGGQQGGQQGGGGGICWVAREVYGVQNPKWLLFRHWLRTAAPRWLYDTYAGHGEAFAAWIHDKPVVKVAVRFLMDQAIMDQALPQCPPSE